MKLRRKIDFPEMDHETLLFCSHYQERDEWDFPITFIFYMCQTQCLELEIQR